MTFANTANAPCTARTDRRKKRTDGETITRRDKRTDLASLLCVPQLDKSANGFALVYIHAISENARKGEQIIELTYSLCL